jgi:uncharacterized membrane protein
MGLPFMDWDLGSIIAMIIAVAVVLVAAHLLGFTFSNDIGGPVHEMVLIMPIALFVWLAIMVFMGR